jgi:hypothetical protein
VPDIAYYECPDGRQPFSDWFDTLDATAAARVATAIDRLGDGNPGDVKPVGEGVSEDESTSVPATACTLAAMGRNWSCFWPVGPRSGSRPTFNTRRRSGPNTNGEKRRTEMPLTRAFKDLVKARADRDPRFRAALLREALNAFVRDDMAAGKSSLRTYVNATIGFEELGRTLSKTPQSLMRMLGPKGNPTAGNLFALINVLQEYEGVTLDVATHPVGAK